MQLDEFNARRGAVVFIRVQVVRGGEPSLCLARDTCRSKKSARAFPYQQVRCSMEVIVANVNCSPLKLACRRSHDKSSTARWSLFFVTVGE